MTGVTRLFVAVWPPTEVVEQLMSLPRKDLRGVRFVPPDNWHLTLRFLGEASIGDAIAALDDLALPEAHVELGPAVDVRFRRMIVVPASGLDALAAVVGRHTGGIGTHDPERFVGHLTLARLGKRASLPDVVGARFDAAFDVGEIALVRSRLERDGARYETIETWSVDGPTSRDR
jgi:2'-5' RNA ligase